MRWRLASDRRLISRSWDGQCVVYDCAAGDTHLLDGVAASVFARLAQGPQEQSALARQLQPGLPAHDSERAWQLAGAIADELAALGLVEGAP